MTDKTFDVAAIGNAIVDVIASADDQLLERHGMPKGGMQLVDDDVAAAIYDEMGPAVEVSGGSAANTAAGVASFGGRAAFVGRIAADTLGEVFGHDIRAAGVHFDPVTVSAGDEGGTGRCLVLVTPDAQRTMNTHLGVAGLISPDDIDPDVISAARTVYCEGYLWDRPAAKDALVKAMDLAAGAGGEVAFTLSDSFCVERHRDDFLALVADRIDILFANEAELLALYETDSWDHAVASVSKHCAVACLTRSERGSLIATSVGERIEVAAVSHGSVVDTTGAGDLYAAGFLYGRSRGLPLADAGHLGSLAAGEVISHVGARPAASLADLAAAAGTP
jgi:sugar/nucleoside kinase (ribokinase family)